MFLSDRSYCVYSVKLFGNDQPYIKRVNNRFSVTISSKYGIEYDFLKNLKWKHSSFFVTVQPVSFNLATFFSKSLKLL